MGRDSSCTSDSGGLCWRGRDASAGATVPRVHPPHPCCSQKLKWYALCPVVDSLNHNSFVEVRPCQPRPLHALPAVPAVGAFAVRRSNASSSFLTHLGPCQPFLQSDVSFEYFKDSFALQTSSAYRMGEQVEMSSSASLQRFIAAGA